MGRLNAAASALKTDGDARPIDAIRADLTMDLLHGTPLADAVRTHLTGLGRPVASACERPATDQAGAPDDRRIPSTTRDRAEHVALAGEKVVLACERKEDIGDADRRDGTDDAERSPKAAFARGTRMAIVRDGHGDASAIVERDIGAVVARAADRVLRLLAERWIDATRSTDGEATRSEIASSTLSETMRRAVGSIDRALAPLRAAWCRATAPDAHENGYRPPAALRRQVTRRYSRCGFPTCNQRAEKCDLDHTTPWHKGGPTCACNLAPLCRHHHRLKQHPRWLLTQPWPGLLIWISPSGKWYVVTSRE